MRVGVAGFVRRRGVTGSGWGNVAGRTVRSPVAIAWRVVGGVIWRIGVVGVVIVSGVVIIYGLCWGRGKVV